MLFVACFTRNPTCASNFFQTPRNATARSIFLRLVETPLQRTLLSITFQFIFIEYSPSKGKPFTAFTSLATTIQVLNSISAPRSFTGRIFEQIRVSLHPGRTRFSGKTPLIRFTRIFSRKIALNARCLLGRYPIRLFGEKKNGHKRAQTPREMLKCDRMF